jgi:hypothetical protein
LISAVRDQHITPGFTLASEGLSSELWLQFAVERGEIHTGLSWRSQKERDHQDDIDVDCRIILRWILEK